jgi:hypothetical protein
MATTGDWRQPLSGWLKHFSDWAGEPDPEAVLRVSIFFDLRAVCGDQALVTRISQALGECGSGGGKAVFLSALARQAASYDVPLGFFRRFVLESKGEHRETLEIKAAGLMPLTDLVRVRALQGGVTEPGTQERLQRLMEKEKMTRRDADRLAGAHRLLAGCASGCTRTRRAGARAAQPPRRARDHARRARRPEGRLPRHPRGAERAGPGLPDVNLVQRFRLVLARRKSRWPLQARLLRQPLPTPGTPLAELEFVALELETTGPEPGRDELLAAGWVLMRGERIVMASARELRVRLRPPDGTGQEDCRPARSATTSRTPTTTRPWSGNCSPNWRAGSS